jgi:hypothetical protein
MKPNRQRNRIILAIFMGGIILAAFIIWLIQPPDTVYSFRIYHHVSKPQMLYTEVRVIPKTIQGKEQIRQVIREVQAGPQNPLFYKHIHLPIRLEALFVTPQSAFVYFVPERNPYGANGITINMTQLHRFLNSVYTTLKQNFSYISDWHIFWEDNRVSVIDIRIYGDTPS